MATLAELLSQATATVAAKASVTAAKERVKKARNPLERDAAVADTVALQATLDWRPVALVYREEHWTCQCGHEGFTPDGLFVLYEHTRMANSTRLSRPRHESENRNDLPKRILVEARVVMLCGACCAGFIKSYAPPITVNGRRPTPLLPEQRVYAAEWVALTTSQEADNDAAIDD